MRIEVSRMDKAPAPIDRRMIEQPCHRSLTRPGDTILDFPHLFGNMDMDRRLSSDRDNLREIARRHGAQTVRSDPHGRVVQVRKGVSRRFDET